ncbi:hypothetical protein NW759_008699 [Fusarium solani]|nr:hypothetical protein NW759_008699 [Fusarium solani]
MSDRSARPRSPPTNVPGPPPLHAVLHEQEFGITFTPERCETEHGSWIWVPSCGFRELERLIAARCSRITRYGETRYETLHRRGALELTAEAQRNPRVVDHVSIPGYQDTRRQADALRGLGPRPYSPPSGRELARQLAELTDSDFPTGENPFRMEYENYQSPPAPAPSTSPSNQEARLKDLIILQAAANNLRRDGNIGEIEDHVLQLLPEPEQSLTDQSPAEVMLLRIEAAIARLKTELDPSQLAEIFPAPPPGHSDGNGTLDNPFVVDAPPTSQAPVTGSTPSTSAATVSTINATFPTSSFSFFVPTSTVTASASTAPVSNPILPTFSSTAAAPASTVTASTSSPTPAPSIQAPDVFQRSESQARSMASPSYAEKYAGNREEGRKRITPEPGPFKTLPGWDDRDNEPVKPSQTPDWLAASLEADRATIMALQATPVADIDGDAFQADMVGQYELRVWRTWTFGDLAPTSLKRCHQPLRAFNVAVRCSRMAEHDPDSIVKATQRLLLRNQPLPSHEAPRSAVVGFSGITAQPVTARAPGKENSGHLDAGDNSNGIYFKTEPGSRLCGGNVIWHESMTVPGNIAAIKRLVIHNDRNFPTETDPIKTLRQEHTKLAEGFPFTPLSFKTPTDQDNSRRPALAKLYMGDFSESIDSHFRLKIPCLGILSIPKELGTRLDTFLWAFPYDPMPQNLAIQAVLVYKHLKDTGAEEPYATPRTGKHHPVPDVSLSVFILYWPHFLRFHEVHKLSRYMHPFRFISAHYAKDIAGSSSLAISDYHLDGKRILSLAGFIRSGSPDIATEHWIEVLPHSMPGTSLIWPTGTGAAERGRKGIFALCLLNDIRLVGLPSYHRRASWLQMIAVPSAVANLTLRSYYAGQLYAPTFPYPRFWDPSKGGSFVAVTGDAMTVGPFFKDIPLDTSIDTSSDLGPNVPLAEVFQNPIFDPTPYKPFLRSIAERNRMRLRLAQTLGIPQESLDFSPETGLLFWEGMSSEIAEAVEKGTIPLVLKQAQPVAQEVRRAVEPIRLLLLDMTATNKILKEDPGSHSVIREQGTAFELILVATGMIEGRVTTTQDLGSAWQKRLSDGFPQSLPSLRTDLDMLARLIDLPAGVWATFGQKFASFMESPVFTQQEELLEMLDGILDKLDPVAKEEPHRDADGQEGEE